MEEYIKSMARYNIWANSQVCNWIRQLTDAQWTLPQQSSFLTIADTVAHIIAAEAIWLERLNLVTNPIWIGNDPLGTKEDYIAKWESTSVELQKFCSSLNEEKLSDLVNFKRLNGEEFSLEVQSILCHVFNHSTYHRGQIVTMLRGAGYVDITSIDLSTFYLKH